MLGLENQCNTISFLNVYTLSDRPYAKSSDRTFWQQFMKIMSIILTFYTRFSNLTHTKPTMKIHDKNRWNKMMLNVFMIQF